jgi:hypothetical protein
MLKCCLPSPNRINWSFNIGLLHHASIVIEQDIDCRKHLTGKESGRTADSKEEAELHLLVQALHNQSIVLEIRYQALRFRLQTVLHCVRDVVGRHQIHVLPTSCKGDLTSMMN